MSYYHDMGAYMICFDAYIFPLISFHLWCYKIRYRSNYSRYIYRGITDAHATFILSSPLRSFAPLS